MVIGPAPKLEAITSADIIHIHRGLSHPDVIRYYAVRFMTLEATKEQMDWYAGIEQAGTGRWWSIRSDNEEFLGAIGINNIVPEHRRCELGFWLLPEHWRKGIMARALPLVIEHCFKTLGLHRIMAEVESDNQASVGVLRRAGFVHEGTLCECEWKDGRAISLDVFALLNEA